MQAKSGTVSFDRWTFDKRSGDLSYNGEKVETLRPKTALLLHILLLQPHAILSQDELLKSVWPETTVSSNVLLQSIRELRSALGDDAKHPQYIKTHAKRGYEWLMSATQPQGAIFKRSKAWLLAIPILASILLFALSRHQEPTPEPPSSAGDVAVLPFINDTGDPDYQWVEHGLRDMVSTAVDHALHVNALPGYAIESKWVDLRSLKSSLVQGKLEGLRTDLGVSYVVFVRVSEAIPFQFHIIVASEIGLRYDELVVADFSEVVPVIIQHLAPLIGENTAEIDLRHLGVSVNPEANEAFARGIQSLRTEGASQAIHYFERANIFDSEYQWPRVYAAMAWAQLGHGVQAEKAFETVYRETSWTEPNVSAFCLTQWAALDIQYGDIKRAETHIDEAIAISRAYEFRFGLAQALLKKGYLLTLSGHWTLAQAIYEEALGISRDLKDPNTEAASLLSMASNYQSIEAFQGHEDHFMRAINFYRISGNKRDLASAYFMYGLLMPADRAEERANLLDRAQKEYANLSDPMGMATVDLARGVQAIQANESELAAGYFSCSYQTSIDYETALFTAETNRLSGWAKGVHGVRSGSPAMIFQAKTQIDSALDEFRFIGVPIGVAAAQFFLAILDFELGNFDAAIVLLTQARLTFEAAGMGRVMAYSDLQIGEIHMRKRNWAQAFSSLEKANQYFNFTDGRTLELMARCQFEQQHFQRAVDLQLQAAAGKPSDSWSFRENRLTHYQDAQAGRVVPDLGHEPSYVASM